MLAIETPMSWVGQNAAAISAIAALVTALTAVWALRRGAADSRERSRPVVIAEFRRAQYSDSTIDLVISNVGQTMARDLRVKFSPEIALPEDTSQLLSPFLVRRYQELISALAPGQELSNIWYSADYGTAADTSVNREPTPDEVTIDVAYRGPGRKMYRDAFSLDVDIVKLTTYSVDSDSIRGRIDGIHKSLQSIAGAAKKCAQAAETTRRVNEAVLKRGSEAENRGQGQV